MKIQLLKIISQSKLLIGVISALVIGGTITGIVMYQRNTRQPPQSFDVDFAEEGNITSNCTLVYEAPGQPALSTELTFRDYSEGDISGDLLCGQRVFVEGQILEEEANLPTKVKVLTLTKIGQSDDTQSCCVPSEEVLPDSDSEYEGFTTYRNEKYRYEIKWHQQWKQQGENDPPSPPPPSGMCFTRRYSVNPAEYCDFSIVAYDGADWFLGELEHLKYDDKTQRSAKIIAGQKAVNQTLNNDYQHVETYYFSYNDIAYRMGYNYKKTDRTERECLPVFETMVASFTLLD